MCYMIKEDLYDQTEQQEKNKKSGHAADDRMDSLLNKAGLLRSCILRA